ncbi:MAG: DUF2163 domain-containing protein [Rhodobacteraceae bacterium]|nr:DUF2163 domain-containing protein [Paracoccaceae bacterium]
MREVSAAIQAALDSGATTLCTCWKVVLDSGTVLGFSNHDRVLSFDGISYEPNSGFTPSEVELAIGMSISTQEVEGLLDSSKIKAGDVRAGLWDNASIEVYLVDWSNAADRMLLRTASVGQILNGSLRFGAEMRGPAHELNQAGGGFYNPTCSAQFGDGRCGLDLTDNRYKGAGVVGSSDGSMHLYPVALETLAGSDTEGLFTGGVLTFTSGANIGLPFDIKLHISSGATVHLELEEPTPYDIAPGDTFDATIGCPKLAEACHRLFNNVVSFRGYNRIPGNDRSMLQVDPDDEYGNDGRSLFSEPDDSSSPETVTNPAPGNGGFFGEKLGGDE